MICPNSWKRRQSIPLSRPSPIRKPSLKILLAYRSQDTLSQILFSGSRRGQLIAKTKAQLRDLVFRTYPEYEQDPIRNIVLSYAIYGSYYAYTENRHYGEDMVISALGQLTQAVTWTFSE